MDTKTKREAVKDAGTKALAVIGLLAILSAATWGVVRLPDYAPGAWSNISAAVANLTSRFYLGGGEETLVFTMATRNAESGKPFTFSWNESGRTGKTYTFSYECRDGLVFDVPGEDAEKTIACETPYAFVNTTDTLTLIPQSTNNRFLDVLVTISSEDAASGGALITVVNESIADSRSSIDTESALDGTTGTAGTDTSSGAVVTGTEVIGTPPVVSDPNGKPDLFVYIIGVGIIDDETDEFIATSTVQRSQTAAIRFAVMNVGTKNSGPWMFSADLPTSPSYTYRPNAEQASLTPGEHAEFTLSFDRVRSSPEGTVIITLDPAERLDEFTRDNNTTEASFDIIR